VRGRYLAIAAAAWTAVFAGLYVVLIRAQGNSPVWWVVAALAAAIAATRSAGRPRSTG